MYEVWGAFHHSELTGQEPKEIQQFSEFFSQQSQFVKLSKFMIKKTEENVETSQKQPYLYLN